MNTNEHRENPLNADSPWVWIDALKGSRRHLVVYGHDNAVCGSRVFYYSSQTLDRCQKTPDDFACKRCLRIWQKIEAERAALKEIREREELLARMQAEEEKKPEPCTRTDLTVTSDEVCVDCGWAADSHGTEPCQQDRVLVALEGTCPKCGEGAEAHQPSPTKAPDAELMNELFELVCGDKD